MNAPDDPNLSSTASAAQSWTGIGVPFAGFWRRVLAYLIDASLLATVGMVITAGLVSTRQGDAGDLSNLAIVFALASWAYFAIMESSPLQATVGKLAIGLFVTDTHGDPIGFLRASARYWLKILSAAPLMLGFLMAALTLRKQALHDLVAGTLVLRRQDPVATQTTKPAKTGDYWDGSRWSGATNQKEASPQWPQ